MAVYVDDFNVRYRNMVMCHMIADTHSELVEMADRIGVNRKWIQDEGTHREHFNVCRNRKHKALIFGAKEVTRRELVRLTLLKKKLQ